MEIASKVLLVEDNLEARLLVQATLEGLCEVVNAGSGAEAISQLERQAVDLIILDIGLPDTDGYHLAAKIRADKRNSSTPILFLTGKSELTDKLMAFSLGADDYIVKPFDVMEFRAKLAAKLKYLKQQSPTVEWIQRGNIRINASEQLAILSEDGKPDRTLNLTPLEFRLLHYLAQREDKVLTRDQILNDIWTDRGMNVVDRTVDRHIFALRQKLGPSADYLETLTNVGYRFTCQTESKSGAVSK